MERMSLLARGGFRSAIVFLGSQEWTSSNITI